MFLRFFVITAIFSVTLWYLHEFHTAQFMAVTRNIPYLSPLMARLHSSIGSSGKKDKSEKMRENLFTAKELLQYNGDENSKGVYIALLGKVYDVASGKKHYGPGGTYHIFAGRDSSRAFVTGEFTMDKVSDDVLDLSLSDILSLKQWQEFYDKDYIYRGKLIGRYFTEAGEKTSYHRLLDEKLEEADSAKNNENEHKKSFPPCNTEWSADKGSKVWCSKRSGGVQRDWTGVPRKLYLVGSDKHSCVCINMPALHNPDSPQYSRRYNLEEYTGCEPNETTCIVHNS